MAQHAHDLGAERALLGAVILNHDQALAAFLSVPEHAYYNPRHQAVAGVIRDMIVRRQAVDAITVLSAIEEAGLLMRVGGAPYLHTLTAARYVVAHAMSYAERLLELYGRRRLWEELTREASRLDSDWEASEEGHPVAASIGTIRSVCDELISYSAGMAVQEPMSLTELLATPDHYDWLVPGLLERQDRVILTGAEGFGKSELVGQIALSVAASVHPFTGDIMEGVEPRVLFVDCENSKSQSRRRYRRIVNAVNSMRAMYQAPEIDWGKRISMEFRPSGVDLLKGSEVAWLEALVASATPDLLVLGPLYKLHNGNINDGAAARQILDVMDRLRERHNLAIVTEAHASKTTDSGGNRLLAPEGSGLFLRWPEFGFGLRRNKDNPMEQADVVSWRGQREERGWPTGLIRRHSGLLPWGPTPDYYDRPDAEWSGLVDPEEN